MVRKLRPGSAAALKHAWRFWARPEQLAPGTKGAALSRKDWVFWLLMAGRGFGKTRAGAEWIIERAKEMPEAHFALVGSTADDVRKTMLSAGLEDSEGASGILAVSPPDFRPVYSGSKRTLTWPNGCVATLYSAEEPDRLRGPQHHAGWADEIAAWQRLQGAWDMFLLGLRLGKAPQAVITTTPRPIKLIRQLLADPRTVVTSGSTYDNRQNLSKVFFDSIVASYEGTRLGRQEIYAEVLDDHPGALWTIGLIDSGRVKAAPATLSRVVVAIDPAVSSSEDSAETGLVVAGIGPCDCRLGCPTEMHGFVLADGSDKFSSAGWAKEAQALSKKHRADRIVAEVNNGGDLVEAALRAVDARTPYRAVHASRGKAVRAEPVAALYERAKVHHVGCFPRLEDQLTTWDPISGEKSPDRLDALVWALSDLMLADNAPARLAYQTVEKSRDWSAM